MYGAENETEGHEYRDEGTQKIQNLQLGDNVG
jgi:hypothetical protein